MTPEACKDACEVECSFRCVSFDFLPSSKRCYLQMVNRYQYALSSSTSYDYYERNCYSKWIDVQPPHDTFYVNVPQRLQPLYLLDDYKACSADSDGDWTGPKYGKSFKSFKTLKTINKLTVDQCKVACQQTETFHCRGFKWHRGNNNCYLTAMSRLATRCCILSPEFNE